jgi:ribonuclease HII
MVHKKQKYLKKYFQSKLLEAGCDESGRGCLAGPVFAAAVILKPSITIKGLNDSKMLSSTKRDALREDIEKNALSWSVAMIGNDEIDRLNIYKASMKAMHLALDGLNHTPQYLLVDGNKFIPYKKVPYSCIVKGDATYQSIAAASILAKTHRDEYMQKIHAEFVHYGWDTNKGYATQFHRAAIKQHGICKHHRRSFTLFNTQLEIQFD